MSRHIMLKESTVLELVDMLNLVFGNDWEHTKACLADDYQEFYISKNATFLQPGIDDESNNWANRGALLNCWRRFEQECESALGVIDTN